MKIQDCQMDISCQRTASAENEIQVSLRARSEGQWASFKDMVEQYRKDGKALPEPAKEQLGRQGELPESWSAGAVASSQEDRRQRVGLLLQEMIAKLFAMLTAQGKCTEDETDAGLPDLGDKAGTSSPATMPATWHAPQATLTRWESDTQVHVAEKESTNVCAKGSVRTADGRCIDFDLTVAMSREFEVTYAHHEEGSQMLLRDPLVLNFDGKAAELADTRFDFDLDADGKAESVAGLGQGSAFLALDRNRDGRINDGKELFGAQSGNGFADLKAYDTDGNNWIDEADAVYSQLRVWRPGAENGGQGSQQTLGEAGVGALWLGSVDSQFSLKDRDNQTQGQVRQTGVWLAENGQAGVMQQVDLATTS